VVFLIFLVIVAVVVHRAMTPEQRANAARSLLEHLRVAKTVAMRTRPECEAFHEALRGRT